MGGGIHLAGTDRLSDLRVKAFIKASRAGTAATKKLSDGNGLYLMITPAGSPVWRIKYRRDGKEKTYAAGVYPEISLEKAREQRDVVRAHLREGRDPVVARQLHRAENITASEATFAGATASWLAKRKPEWSDIHYLKSKQALERDVLPALGAWPINQVTAPILARVIEKVVGRGANQTAEKILFNVRGIFELAMVQPGSTIRENPCLAVRAVLTQTKPHQPRKALLEFKELGAVLRAADVAALTPAVRMAHRLVAFTASRIGNAVEAQWHEFDLDGETPSWSVPRSQMKMQDGRRHDHRVLLGPTIANELRRWRSATGGKGFVFPSPHGTNAHITREALEKSYRVTLGLEGKHTVHGWRAAFATLARDNGFAREVVELTLDHVHDNEVARAYDRGGRLNERAKLMAWWDASLLAAQEGREVLPVTAAPYAAAS